MPQHILFANSIINQFGVPTKEKTNQGIKIKIFYIKLQIIFATFAIRFYYIYMGRNNAIGRWGEEMATEYLITKGYTVVERNVRLGHNEIDIIAIKDNRIIFAEVKTRTEESEDLRDVIDLRKKQHLCNATEAYIRMKKVPHAPQIDIIIVIGTPDTEYKIQHYPDAFRPPLRSR